MKINVRPVTRRALLGLVATTALAACPFAFAQKYPDKPIRLVVPFAAGGGTDILARDLAPRLSDALGQQVIVDNRGGAGGNIGSDIVAKAPADGYTILFGSNTLSINASLYKNLPFDTMKAFAPIGMVATAPMVLVVHADSPYKTVPDLVNAAKAKPGTLNWSGPGLGTPHHLAEEIFNKTAGADITVVQYKGAGPAMNDLLARHTQASVLTLAAVRPHIASGKLRALGVATATRTALMPEVPTIAEAGVPGYSADLWYGLFAPVGTPDAVLATLNAALNKTLADKDVQQRFVGQGYEAKAGTPRQLMTMLSDDLARSGKVIADGNIKPE